MSAKMFICRNSPYVINVKALSLEDDDDDAYVKMSEVDANVYKSGKSV